MGPAARTFAQTSQDARRQFRGWCNNRAARRQAGARQPRSGSWNAPQARMCASKRKACLQGASGQRLGSLHDCAWRRTRPFLLL